MAKQTRDVLKTYFEDGDTPDQIEFGHLIDSQVNLEDPGEQIVKGTLSASAVGADAYFLKGLAFEQVTTSQISLTGSNIFGSGGAAPTGITSHSFFGPIYQSSSGAHSASYFLTPVIMGGTETNLEGEGLHIQSDKTIGLSINPISQSISASLLISGANSHLAVDPNEIHHYGNQLYITSQGTAGSGGNILFRTSVNPTETPSSSLYISSSGNIGIGTITPKEKLVVEGNISSSGNIISNGNITSSGNINIKGNGSNTFTGNITSSGTISASGAIYASSFVGSANFTGFQLNDNNKLELGDSQDLELYHDGTDSFIHNTVGDLTISLDTVGNDKDIIFKVDNDEYIRLDSGLGSSTKFSKQINIGATGGSNGVDAFFYSDTSGRYMHWDASDNALNFKDDTKLKIGSGGDLQIYHDGANSYISQSGTGNLIIPKVVDTSNVPIIARNIITQARITAGSQIADDVDTYRVFAGGDGNLEVTLTAKTINPQFLVTAHMGLGTEHDNTNFQGRIVATKVTGTGADLGKATLRFADSAANHATDIPLGKYNPNDESSNINTGVVANALVKFNNYTTYAIAVGDQIKVTMEVRVTNSDKDYFMNRSEANPANISPHSFITVEEIPQANG